MNIERVTKQMLLCEIFVLRFKRSVKVEFIWASGKQPPRQ
jgi:hypothetical protein